MVLELKLQKVGKAITAVFPGEALRKLNVQTGDSIFLSESPDGFRVTAQDPNFQDVIRSTEKVMQLAK
jgi:hypothetical protein